MTQIIATIGPASMDESILTYFKENSVRYARLNTSHGEASWHIATGEMCKKAGLEVLLDLCGPKIRLGQMQRNVEVQAGHEIMLELEDMKLEYPRKHGSTFIIPVAVDIFDIISPGQTILIDDGKLNMETISVSGKQALVRVIFGGTVKPRKGINVPGRSPNLNFLTSRDIEMLQTILPVLKPEVIAASFVQKPENMIELAEKVNEIIIDNGITGYKPLLCPKIEQSEAVVPSVLAEIVENSDLIMVARGDLALETEPLHIEVPFLQEKIKQECKKQNKAFIVATQVLETMTDNPVPTRAEVSDLYRAVITDEADYVMLSGETAAGSFPKQAVSMMHEMIKRAG
jgi:pyruvate kinase